MLGFINENDNTIMGAVLLLERSVLKFKVGYVPGGFLIDYDNDNLFRDFITSLKNYLKEKKLNSGINYDNYYKGYIEKSNYHTLARQDLDRAIAMAYSIKDFENIMKKMGYEIINRYGKYSIRRDPYKKNIRIERSFGSEYSIDEIEKRIENTTATRVPFLDAYNPIKKVRVYEKAKKQKSKGLYGLYKYYCYILKVYPRHYPRRIMSPSLRVEIQKMDEISMQTRLLVSKEIKTYEQLLFYRNELVSNIEKLEERRTYLWIKIKRVASNEEKQKIPKGSDDC